MIYRDTQDSLRSLYAVAGPQGGYFTAKQAAEVGYQYPHLAYHLRVGNFERVGHGLYRLPTIPPSEHDDLIRLTLWSRDREDAPQAVISHDSALFLYQLSDLLPHRIHFTVPNSFRKHPPRGCKMHKGKLTSAEVEQREGFTVTSPLRTLLDVAHEPDISQEQVAKALADAIERGLVRSSAVKEALKPLRHSNDFCRLASLVR